MRENERMHNGTTQSSGSDSDEVSQLKAALESAKKERMALQEDRERERKMFIENNARVRIFFRSVFGGGGGTQDVEKARKTVLP